MHHTYHYLNYSTPPHLYYLPTIYHNHYPPDLPPSELFSSTTPVLPTYHLPQPISTTPTTISTIYSTTTMNHHTYHHHLLDHLNHSPPQPTRGPQ
ncbi:hypothetical protein Pcinc_021821 [Petrolisthes cinctipes]|uniref:Uncharacterized protein n=1 Tax=Petrolisthes cinctipes TaxID=88211 RepID=A0AAE1FF76_PETCI|nr:hypothetical protein Pcinc_021821 [Petrolisthes cinctipes]